MLPTDFQSSLCLTNVTIASGQTESSEADLGGTTLVGILLATMTSTAMTFKAALTGGGTSVIMKDGAGNSISKTIASNQFIAIDPTLFRGARFLKVVGGSAEGADRTVTLVSKPI